MILTKEDLHAIGEMIDQKVDAKLDEKLTPVLKKVDFIGEKVDLIAQLMNLSEVIENSRGASLNLIHKVHKPKV